MKTKKQINAIIATIGSNNAKQRQVVHEVLCDIAGHIVQHGECSLANKLMETVGNGVNRKGIAMWLAKNAFVFMKDGVMTVAVHKRKDFINAVGMEVEARSIHEAECLLSVPWYEISKKKDDADVAAVWDGEAKLEQFRKYIAKLAKEATDAKDAGLVDLLNGIVANINSAKFDVVEAE